MSNSVSAPYNSDVVITLHASETLPTGLNDRSMGFKLARGQDGQLLFTVKDLAPGELVARVQAQGFEINPQTLEATFYKDRWDGPFGAFEERPGAGRPAHADDMDLKGPKPVLAPKRYGMTYKTYTAATISFSTTTPGTISDSANGLAEFKTGDVIVVTGSASNNGTYNISTGAVAGTIRTTEATAVEGAGASVTITVSNSDAVIDAKPFGSAWYVQTAGKFVYKVTNWGTPGSEYLVSVWKHTGGGSEIGAGLHVHNGYLYALYGTGGAYCYTADGTTWVVSNRGGTDQQAHEMTTLRGVLHKRLGQNHQQLSASTSTGINGGETWASADQIGDTSYAIGRTMVLHNSLVFATTASLENLDDSGNSTSLLPKLRDMAGAVKSGAAIEWLNNSIVVPMLNGGVKIYQNGQAIPATPSSQVERVLGITQQTNPPITEGIDYTASAGDFVYASQIDSDDDMRVLELEQVGEGAFIWRNFIFSRAASPAFNRMGALYVPNTANAGPVLWMDGSVSATRFNYWLIPSGRDATQDSRSRYTSSGIIYDPFITFGCPEVQKRWSHIEVACTQSNPTNYAKTTYTCDAYNEAGSDVITTNSLTMASGITIGTINFNANTISRRARLVHTLANTGASQEVETPILLWVRVHAFLLPTPKYQFSMVLQAPATDSTATQDQKRRFLKAIRTAQLPMTLQDRFGTSWTVNRAVEQPTESYTQEKGIRTEETYTLTLVQQPAGV